jgi:D-alanine-D-alanine ligase
MDVLVQVDAVSKALSELEYELITLPFGLDLPGVVEKLRNIKPDFVFNLVESVEGKGSLIHLAPALLDFLGIPYTGAGTDAMFTTSNKIISKTILKGAEISTPHWLTLDNAKTGTEFLKTRYIIKSVWEHASIGLDDNSIIFPNSQSQLIEYLKRKQNKLQGQTFAEVYIEGREFNLSVLAGEVLSPAEIIFTNYSNEKPKMVGYRAKWESESFEFNNTPRRFDFPEEDYSLIARLKSVALDCWQAFSLKGYARVDFRVDQSGNPWVLEVNTNPCLSPDAGFAAALEKSGISFKSAIERIISDSINI